MARDPAPPGAGLGQCRILVPQSGRASDVLEAGARAAAEILKRFPDAEFRTSRRDWDPFAFIAFCDRARMQPGSMQETAAREIQRAEWQILFDHSARPQ